jgi:hypothetical protein
MQFFESLNQLKDHEATFKKVWSFCQAEDH